LNTRGGILDPGSGQLEDGSINAIINEADLLEKRKGLIRGIDERFSGVVCGLFKYTDECGVEYIVVADEDSIKVRQPFDIPEFLGSDSLPFDDFETLDTTRWTNTDDYQAFLGALRLRVTATESNGDFVPTADLMQWFKQSVLTSYFIEIQYRMDAQVSKQVASAVIKRSNDGQSYLIASVVNSATEYKVLLQYVQSGVRTTLAESNLGGGNVANGFLRISYSVGSSTFTASARVIPVGATQVTVTGTINELQDSALGQFSAIGLTREDEDTGVPEIEQVFGGVA
jgi:hypothetical protein